MTKILSIYTNCSRGGMSTVYLNRALNHPTEHHTLIFLNDRGGYHLFSGVENIDVRVIRNDRVGPYLSYITSNFSFDEIRITSLPELIKNISALHQPRLVYEFHTSTQEIVTSELSKFDATIVDHISVPSDFSKSMVCECLPVALREKVLVQPNPVLTLPQASMVPDGKFNFGDKIPLLWIGRFDAGKNARDFLRILAMLPTEYKGLVVVSLEHDPTRMDDFLADAYTYNVVDRISVYLNLSPEQISSLYVNVAAQHGYYCSTSLNESFGFTVAEASGLGLRVLGYEVGALSEHRNDLINLFPVGDNKAIVTHILNSRREIGRAQGGVVQAPA